MSPSTVQAFRQSQLESQQDDDYGSRDTMAHEQRWLFKGLAEVAEQVQTDGNPGTKRHAVDAGITVFFAMKHSAEAAWLNAVYDI